MSTTYLLCIGSILLWLIILFYAAKYKSDLLHPAVIFSILFIVTYPLKLLLSHYGFHTLDSMSVDQSTIVYSIFTFNLAAFSFVLPLLCIKPIETGFTIFRFTSLPPYYCFLISIFLIILSYGTNAFISIFTLEGLQGRISERANERLGSGFFALLRNISLFFLIIYALKCSAKKRISFLTKTFILIYSFFILLLSGSKYQALLLPAIFFTFWYYKNRSKGRNILTFYRFLLVAIISLFSIGFAGYIRGAGNWGGPKHSFIAQVFHQARYAFDAPDNLIILLDRTKEWITGEVGFSLVSDYFILPFIPRFFWADKPLIRGNQFVMQKYFPERFGGHLGEAISPSFPGELIITGGFFYMIIFTLMFGFIVAKCYINSQRIGGIYMVVYIWILLNIFNIMRSASGTLGSLLMFLMTILPIYFFLCIIYDHQKNTIICNR